MVSARKLKRQARLSQRKRRLYIRSQLVFSVEHDPLDASAGVVLTLWSGARAVSRSLSPEWAAALARLLIPGSQEC